MCNRTAHAVRWFRKFLGFQTSSALKGTRRAFKFRRGQISSVVWSAWVWGLSLMGLQVSGVRVFQRCEPCRFWDCPPMTARDLLYLTGSSFFGRLWVSAGSRTFWVLKNARLPPPLLRSRLVLWEETPHPLTTSRLLAASRVSSSWPPVSRTFRRLWGHFPSPVLGAAAIERSSGQKTSPRPPVYDRKQQTLTGPKPESPPGRSFAS